MYLSTSRIASLESESSEETVGLMPTDWENNLATSESFWMRRAESPSFQI